MLVHRKATEEKTVYFMFFFQLHYNLKIFVLFSTSKLSKMEKSLERTKDGEKKEVLRHWNNQK